MSSYDRAVPLRYVVAALPGWTLGTALGYGLHAWAGVSWWTAALVPALWIAVDAMAYPSRRRFYESEPAARWLIGARGVALTPLQQNGLVRVRGEIWQARVGAGAAPILRGAHVRIRDIEGLRLIVEAESPG